MLSFSLDKGGLALRKFLMQLLVTSCTADCQCIATELAKTPSFPRQVEDTTSCNIATGISQAPSTAISQ